MTKGNVICLLSAKGGAGKTVTAGALGTYLSAIGLRVLLVDADAATNGMTLLFLEQVLSFKKLRSEGAPPPLGLFDARGDAPLAIEISDGLHFIPASYSMAQTDGIDEDTFRDSLRLAIAEQDKYDIVLIDAEAGTDQYAHLAATVADTHVILSECDPISMQGVDRLRLLFRESLDHDRTFVLLNKVLPEVAPLISSDDLYCRYLPAVSWNMDVVRALARRDLATNIEEPNIYTLSTAQIALRLLPETAGQRIDIWRQRTLDEKLAPIRSRLSALDLIVDHLERKAGFRWRIFSAVSAVTLVALASLWLALAVRIGGSATATSPLPLHIAIGGGIALVTAALIAWLLRQSPKLYSRTLSEVALLALSSARQEKLELQEIAKATEILMAAAGQDADKRPRPRS